MPVVTSYDQKPWGVGILFTEYGITTNPNRQIDKMIIQLLNVSYRPDVDRMCTSFVYPEWRGPRGRGRNPLPPELMCNRFQYMIYCCVVVVVAAAVASYMI